MDDKKPFGEYIRKKRQEAGLTQNQLAQRLFVAESTVSKWERGLSYPDVALIPAVCRELGISEHEFFTACDDESCRVQAWQARAWRGLTRGWQIFFAVSYGIAILVCFICNLAIFHRLNWFWIVLTSLMLAFSFTNLPFLVKKDRPAVCLAAATASLVLLLFSCWSYVGGMWWILGALVITAVSLALPWGIWAIRRLYGQYTAVLAMAAFTVWVFLLLAVIRLFAGGSWLLGFAYPIAALSLAFIWAGFAIVRWLPLGALGRAGALLLLVAFAIPAGQALALWLSPGGVVPVVDYFAWWRLFSLARAGELGWINLLVFDILAAAGAALLIAGGIRASRGKRA